MSIEVNPPICLQHSRPHPRPYRSLYSAMPTEYKDAEAYVSSGTPAVPAAKHSRMKSFTELFNRLRPSQRAEKGHTQRYNVQDSEHTYGDPRGASIDSGIGQMVLDKGSFTNNQQDKKQGGLTKLVSSILQHNQDARTRSEQQPTGNGRVTYVEPMSTYSGIGQSPLKLPQLPYLSPLKLPQLPKAAASRVTYPSNPTYTPTKGGALKRTVEVEDGSSSKILSPSDSTQQVLPPPICRLSTPPAKVQTYTPKKRVAQANRTKAAYRPAQRRPMFRPRINRRTSSLGAVEYCIAKEAARMKREAEENKAREKYEQEQIERHEKQARENHEQNEPAEWEEKERRAREQEEQKMYDQEEQRRELRASGDYLGVQGANPQTGLYSLSNTESDIDTYSSDDDNEDEVRQLLIGELEKVANVVKESHEIRKKALRAKERTYRWRRTANGWTDRSASNSSSEDRPFLGQRKTEAVWWAEERRVSSAYTTTTGGSGLELAEAAVALAWSAI